MHHHSTLAPYTAPFVYTSVFRYNTLANSILALHAALNNSENQIDQKFCTATSK